MTRVEKIRYKYNMENLKSLGANIESDLSSLFNSLKARKQKYKLSNNAEDKKKRPEKPRKYGSKETISRMIE